MFEHKVEGNNLILTTVISLPFDSEDVEQAIAEVDGIFPCSDGIWGEMKKIYRAEREKWLKNQESVPQINLDTSQLDDAISKADALILKLKTANLLIKNLKE